MLVVYRPRGPRDISLYPGQSTSILFPQALPSTESVLSLFDNEPIKAPAPAPTRSLPRAPVPTSNPYPREDEMRNKQVLVEETSRHWQYLISTDLSGVAPDDWTETEEFPNRTRDPSTDLPEPNKTQVLYQHIASGNIQVCVCICSHDRMVVSSWLLYIYVPADTSFFRQSLFHLFSLNFLVV